DDLGSGAQLVCILPDQIHALWCEFHELSARSTARKCLEPQRAGSRKQVNHTRTQDLVAEYAHPCLTNPVGRRANAPVARRVKTPAAPLACNYAQRCSTAGCRPGAPATFPR